MRRLILAGIFLLLLIVPAQLAAPAPGAQAAFAGDYNCDAVIDVLDALTALRVGANLQALPSCADPASVDCDVQTDAVDALLILRHAARVAVSLPAGCPDIGALTPGTPPGVAGTDLAKLVSNAPDDEARYDALLQVMGRLRIGVYTADGGEVHQGAERGPGDFYLYDFELRMMAASLGRKDTSWGVQEIADTLDQVGFREDGQPFTGDNLNQILHDATNDSLAMPEEESSLMPMLVRELGLRHETPYDLANDLDVNEAKFDGLQVTLILVGLTLPVIADEGPLETPASTLIADSNGILTAQPVPMLACSDFKGELQEGWTAIKYWTTAVKAIGDVAKKVVAYIDIVHGSVLAFSVRVRALDKVVGPTHYDHGSGSPGENLKFQIEVRMLDDLGEILVKCGWLLTADFPAKGGIPGVRVQFYASQSGLMQHGTVDCTGLFCSRMTDLNGIATLTFDPKSEYYPYGQEPEWEAKGSLRAIAWYQSRFKNLFGTVAQFVTPKGDGFTWSVRWHSCHLPAGGIYAAQLANGAGAAPLAASSAADPSEGLPCAYEGTASATHDVLGLGVLTYTTTASDLRFQLQPADPSHPGGATYKLVQGTVAVQVTGEAGDCTISGGYTIAEPMDDGVHIFGGSIAVDAQNNKYAAAGGVGDYEEHVFITCPDQPPVSLGTIGHNWVLTTNVPPLVPDRSFTPGDPLQGSFDTAGNPPGWSSHYEWSFEPIVCNPSPQPVCQ